MDLHDLLLKRGIAPRDVIVLRHRPSEPPLRKILPWLAAERHDLFNAYQQVQGERLEAAMLKAKFAASFVGLESGRCLFIGLYSITGAKPLPIADFWGVPAHAELRELGMRGVLPEDGREVIQRFELELLDFYSEWKGRLVVGWQSERQWWQYVEAGRFPVLAIVEESLLVPAMPSWDALVLTWQELDALPSSWRAALAQWRGVYFIFDQSLAKGYIGAAYGSENILGRWRNYAETGHGGNRLLRQCDPKNFRFSILQRLSPDAEAGEIIQMESTWKDRLHTRAPSGLNDN